MTATSRWPVVVLVMSLLLIVIAVVSKSWIVGEEHLRAGLWSADSDGGYGYELRDLRGVGWVVAILSAVTTLALVVLIAQAWTRGKLSTARVLVIGGVFLQVLAGIWFVGSEIGDLTTWGGPAFTTFLVGSMGALIGAAALPVEAS